MRTLAAATLFLALAGPIFAGTARAEGDTHKLIVECIVRAAEKVPKIAGLSILNNNLDRHGDMIDGAFIVKAVNQHVYFDVQCSIGPVSTTDLRGVTKTEIGIDKVWLNLRIP